jgi:hypothetical protein
MQHGPDPYTRMLERMDEMLAADKDRNERKLIETIADLARIGRTGQRLADYLSRIAANDPTQREAINELLSAWRHALNH